MKLRPYAGTVAYDKLRRQARLEGGEVFSTFNFQDPVMQRFASFQVKAAARVGEKEPVAKICDLLLSVSVLDRFAGEHGRAETFREELMGLVKQVNRARVSLLRKLLAAAEEHTDGALAIGRWQLVCTETDAKLNLLEQRLGKATEGGSTVSYFYRNYAAAAALTFVLSAGVGCSRVDDLREGNEEGDIEPGDEETKPSAPSQASEQQGDADSEMNGDPGEEEDSETMEIEVDTDSDTGEDTEMLENGCTQTETNENDTRLSDAGWECSWQTSGAPYKVTIGTDGYVEKVTINPESYAAEELETCLLDILSGEQFPCLAGEELEQYYPIVITE